MDPIDLTSASDLDKNVHFGASKYVSVEKAVGRLLGQEEYFHKLPRADYAPSHASRKSFLSLLLEPARTPTSAGVSPPVSSDPIASCYKNRASSTSRTKPTPMAVNVVRAATPLVTKVTRAVAIADVSISGADSNEAATGISGSIAHAHLTAISRIMDGSTNGAVTPWPIDEIQPRPAEAELAQPVVTAPVALTFPYNLPPPLPPTSPQTTRRRMLSAELSESLRRNVLWERQVSKRISLDGARRWGVPGSRTRRILEEKSRASLRGAGNRRVDTDDFHATGW